MNSYSRRRAGLNTGVSSPTRHASTIRRLALAGLYAAATSTLVSSTTRVTVTIRALLQSALILPPAPASARNRGSPVTVRPGLREPGQVRCLHVFDEETAVGDKGRNVARHVTARENPVRNGLGPLLPAPHLGIG